MWEGIWVPGFASEHDLLDWDSLSGQVDDKLIELMHETERTTAVQIGNADSARGLMWDTWTEFMDNYDIMISPTIASATFPLSQFAPSWLEGKSLREQLLDWLFTYPYNMLNNPAVTVPAGFTSDGRPVGLQIAAEHRQDALVLRVARVLEEVRGWADKKPELGNS
jgi:aspartyl-tRNA(Asn)/glutamyl-tRNA(Gln) amidotransferase subunit A